MSQSSKKSSAKLSSDVMATVTALFLEMDSDCNGWLSREELHEGLSRLGFRLSDTTAEVIKTVCLSVSNSFPGTKLYLYRIAQYFLQ